MGDTERLQRGGMVVGAGMEGTPPKALASSCCLFLKCGRAFLGTIYIWECSIFTENSIEARD